MLPFVCFAVCSVRLFRRACLVVGQSSHLLPHPIFPWSCVRAVIHYDATDPDEMEASFDLIIEKWTPTPAFIERVEQGEMHSISLETDVEKTMVLLPPEKREYIRLQPRHPIKVLVSTDFYNANPDVREQQTSQAGNTEACDLRYLPHSLPLLWLSAVNSS